VIYGLQESIFIKAVRVVLHVDSQLVARQLKGEYRVKDQDMRKYHDLALNLFRGFDKVDIEEVPRERNKEADALVNRALDTASLI
jgi:ribonuclease HI